MCFAILGSQGSRVIWGHEENVEGIKNISKLAKERSRRKLWCRHVASILRKEILNQPDTLPTSSEITIKRQYQKQPNKQTNPIKTNKQTKRQDKTKTAKKKAPLFHTTCS